MRTARYRQALSACVVATVLLVACGDDEESSSPTTQASTTTTLSQAQLDKQKAQGAVLTLADLTGYTQDPPDTDPDDAEFEAAAAACYNNNPLLMRLGEDDDPRGAGSPDFSRGENLTVSSGVTFAETEDEARAAIAALGVPTFTGCFSNAFAAQLRKDPTFTNVTVNTTRLPNLTVGDQSLGYRSTIRFRAGGQSLTVYGDFTFLRTGRGVAVLTGENVGTPFPEAERTRLATLIAGRMA